MFIKLYIIFMLIYTRYNVYKTHIVCVSIYKPNTVENQRFSDCIELNKDSNRKQIIVTTVVLTSSSRVNVGVFVFYKTNGFKKFILFFLYVFKRLFCFEFHFYLSFMIINVSYHCKQIIRLDSSHKL
jgi:hypothetical protein